jgi:DNA-binding MarR family transcriptional regulator
MTQPVTHSIAPDHRPTLSRLYNVMSLFEARIPTSYALAFLAVAKNPGRTVSDYANTLGCSNGACSRRLNDLGELYSRDRSQAGLGLLESAQDPMDRRFTIVQLSAKGRQLAAQLAGMLS